MRMDVSNRDTGDEMRSWYAAALSAYDEDPVSTHPWCEQDPDGFTECRARLGRGAERNRSRVHSDARSCRVYR